MSQPERAMDVTAEITRQYWARVDRLIAAAQRAGMDLAVSSPRTVQDPTTLAYSLVWEHQLVEPGGTVTTRGHDVTWIIYRCGEKT